MLYMAQWLGRRSLTGGLSLICAYASSVCDMNSAMDYYSWRLLNGRPGLRVAVWPRGQSLVCARDSLQLMGCTPALSVTQSAAAGAVCGLWRYVSDWLFNLY